jgi:hypothetical protein
VTIGLFSSPAWKFLFAGEDMDKPEHHHAESVILEPVQGSLPFPPVRLSFSLSTSCRNIEGLRSRQRSSSRSQSSSPLPSASLGTSRPLGSYGSQSQSRSSQHSAAIQRRHAVNRVASLVRRSPPIVVSSARVIERPLRVDIPSVRPASQPGMTGSESQGKRMSGSHSALFEPLFETGSVSLHGGMCDWIWKFCCCADLNVCG